MKHKISKGSYSEDVKQFLQEQRLQELCNCAFEQGYGKIAKKSPGVYLPSISKNVFRKLLNIYEEELKQRRKKNEI